MNRVARREQFPSRVLGAVGEQGNGPLLVVIASIHGNEPAGTVAVQRVLGIIESERLRVRGRFVGLIGNMEALEQNRRYLDRDLNRVWGEPGSHVVELDPLGAEERELRQLEEKLESEIAAAADTVAILDLHSTSANGPPFTVISDSLANRQLAMALRIPVVLGLEEEVRGSLLNHLGDRGLVAVGVEGGQHDSQLTVDHHEAALWIALDELGIVEVSGATLEEMTTRLREATTALPHVVELVYRHRIDGDDDFEMAGVYRGFEPVTKGDLLAHERGESILAESDGVIMLPRYQPIGEDGFFIGRPVRPFWLELSALLRQSPLDRLLPFLPGIRRTHREGIELRASTRWGQLIVKLMHLFGYRRWPDEDSEMVFRRRPEPSNGSAGQ